MNIQNISNMGMPIGNNIGSIGGIKGQNSMTPSTPQIGNPIGDMTSISDEAMEEESVGSNFNANGILPLTDAEQARLVSEEIKRLQEENQRLSKQDANLATKETSTSEKLKQAESELEETSLGGDSKDAFKHFQKQQEVEKLKKELEEIQEQRKQIQQQIQENEKKIQGLQLLLKRLNGEEDDPFRQQGPKEIGGSPQIPDDGNPGGGSPSGGGVQQIPSGGGNPGSSSPSGGGTPQVPSGGSPTPSTPQVPEKTEPEKLPEEDEKKPKELPEEDEKKPKEEPDDDEKKPEKKPGFMPKLPPFPFPEDGEDNKGKLETLPGKIDPSKRNESPVPMPGSSGKVFDQKDILLGGHSNTHSVPKTGKI